MATSTTEKLTEVDVLALLRASVVRQLRDEADRIEKGDR